MSAPWRQRPQTPAVGAYGTCENGSGHPRHASTFIFCSPTCCNSTTRFLQFANPPGRVKGTPEFAKTKKRESYFQEFCSVTETFQENRVKAHRLSDEAAAFALQVCFVEHLAGRPFSCHFVTLRAPRCRFRPVIGCP